MKCRTAASLVLVFALSCGAACNRQQDAARPPAAPVDTRVAAQSSLLATISDRDAPVGLQGPSASGHSAPGQPPDYTVVFSRLGKGVAYVAAREAGSHVVHNGKPDRQYAGIGSVALSPDGRRVAYGALAGERWRMVDTGKEGDPFDEVGDPVFSPDGRHLAYEALTGKKWHIVLDGRMNEGCLQYYQKPVFSGDGSKIFYIENTETDGLFRLVVSDLNFDRQSRKEMRASNTVVSKNGARIATAAEEGGKFSVLEFGFDQPDAVRRGGAYDAVSDLAFSADGASLAYVARRGAARLLVFNGKEEPLPDGVLLAPPVIRPDQKGVGVILGAKDGFFLHQGFYQDGIESQRYADAGDLVYGASGGGHAYVAVTGQGLHVVVNGKKGPAYDRVVTPVFTPDGRFVVYRARKDGKRFVVVADLNAKTVRQHPPYEMVFETTFTPDGKAVAYGAKSGAQLWWKVEKL